MLLSHLFPGQPVNSAGHEQCVEVNCCLYFDQTDLWLLLEHQHDPQSRKQRHARHWCCSLAPVNSNIPELCQEQNTASIWGCRNTRDSQKLWKSKTSSFGSRQWQMTRVLHLHTCICSFFHLCKCLKARRDYLVACTDALWINLLPSFGSAIHLNEVWNHVWAGETLEEKKMEWRKRGDRRAGEGAREKRSLSWPCLCSVQLMGGTLGSPSSPSPHLPGKGWYSMCWHMKYPKQLICVVDVDSSHNAKVCWRKLALMTTAACKCFFALLKGQRSN